ncbi:MAG: hypothetical protein SNG27_07640 [Rikenellaceae bacterium]
MKTKQSYMWAMHFKGHHYNLHRKSASMDSLVREAKQLLKQTLEDGDWYSISKVPVSDKDMLTLKEVVRVSLIDGVIEIE